MSLWTRLFNLPKRAKSLYGGETLTEMRALNALALQPSQLSNGFEGNSSICPQMSAEFEKLPLCVDLDGTLLKIDTFHEAILFTLLADWRKLFRLPIWLWKGRAYLKRKVAQTLRFDAAH